MGKKLNRISVKFILGMTVILICSLCLTVVLNNKITWRYCLHRQTQEMQEAGNRLRELLSEEASPEEAVNILESERKVLAVWSEAETESEILSNELREKFRQKGLGFEKFWLWEGDYEKLSEHGEKMRLYQQDRLNYGILTEYLTAEGKVFAIASIVPNIREAVIIINRLLFFITGAALIFTAVLTVFLAGRITRPLKEMEKFAHKIARQEYEPLCIRSHDELETVAKSMNGMCRSIQEYQEILIKKNRQMEELFSNVAHDLKTPISLVGMYAAGIKDGMDDGTFLDIIIRQNKKMAVLTERLLDLSRIGQKDYSREKLDVSEILHGQTKEFLAAAEKAGVIIEEDTEKGLEAVGNRELLEALFSNLISNAVKYTSGKKITVSLKKQPEGPVFSIENETENRNIDTERIWEPFYVGEASRNSELSGTGLGLPIVKKIAQRLGYTVTCSVSDGKIQFRAELFEKII